MSTLEIKDLVVTVEDRIILDGVNLVIRSGETHAIMGPNGTGKSTLAQIIMGHPKYTLVSGEILLDGEKIHELPVDERSKKGLFLAMQSPVEVPGVTNFDFVKAAVQAHQGDEKKLRVGKFILAFEDAAKELKMGSGMSHRYVNTGFSGGEKKRNEILQMKLLQPKFAILDEIDSGLDVDALRIVGENVTNFKSKDRGFLLITHYQRLLDYIVPDFVHIMIRGRIVKTGRLELIKKIDTEGYDWLKAELGIDTLSEEPKRYSLGTCATNVGK